MRIELPFPSWAEAQRVHDDAHTLTVPLLAPAQRPHSLALPLSAGWPSLEAEGARVDVAAAVHAPLTLTF